MEKSDNTKRIAINTFYLYLRMFLVMLVTLYTSRVTLEVLGVQDYGIYNVIGGIVSFLGFFSSSLSNVTQRYLNIGLAKNDEVLTQRYFSQSLILFVIVILIFLILGETLGSWYVLNKLVVPEDKLFDAFWTFQISLFTILIGIIQIPYTSIIIAHEKMSLYAYIGIVEVILKLAIVLILKYRNDYNQIILYAALICLSNFIILCSYVFYSIKKYKESHFKWYWNNDLIKQMATFVGFNLYGCFAYSMGLQGNNIVLNLFFGPIVNAARGIAMQVSASVVRFSDAIMAAIKPQIIKSYSKHEIDYLRFLVCKSTIFTFLIMDIVAIPAVINIDYILKIWLNEVPLLTNQFSILVIIEAMISILSAPLWLTLNAYGNIKINQLIGRTFMMITAPLSYVIIKITHEPTIPFVLMIFSQIGYWILSFFEIRKSLSLSLKTYISSVIAPTFLISLLAAFVAWFESTIFNSDIIILILNLLSTIIIIMSMAYWVVLDNDGRKNIKLIVKRHF